MSTLEFINCTYAPNKKLKENTILNDVSFKIQSEKLNVIMGGSGSGKTTLLRLIKGEIALLGGSIRLNDKSLQRSDVSNIRYVRQEDLFYEFLTPLQHLNYQARLRIGRERKDSRKDAVEMAIKAMNLEKCKNTRISSSRHGGLSGGEKKRLSIASELLTRPNILLIDEPTTGLDSFTAETVMVCLKKLTDSGMTVIAVIHQPSKRVFKHVDSMTYLYCGKVVYNGMGIQLENYLKELGVRINEFESPIETLSYITDRNLLLSESNRFVYEEQKMKDVYLQDDSLDSFISNKTQLDYMDSEWKRLKSSYGVEITDGSSKTSVLKEKTPSCTFITLITRSFMNNLHNPGATLWRLCSSVFAALLIGSIFFKLKKDDVFSLNAVVFFALINQALSALFDTILVFISEQHIAVREYQDGLYHIPTYFLAKTLADLPFQIISPICVTSILWFLIGVRNSAYPKIMLWGILIAQDALSIGYIVAAIAQRQDLATLLSPAYIPFMIMLSGYQAILGTIPRFWQAMAYLSPLRLGVSMYFRIAYENIVWGKCGPIGPPRCYETGEQVLEYYGFEKDSYLLMASIVAIHIVGFRTIALLILTLRYRLSSFANFNSGDEDSQPIAIKNDANKLETIAAQL